MQIGEILREIIEATTVSQIIAISEWRQKMIHRLIKYIDT